MSSKTEKYLRQREMTATKGARDRSRKRLDVIPADTIVKLIYEQYGLCKGVYGDFDCLQDFVRYGPVNFEIDHIIPVCDLSTSNDYDNLQLLCGECNEAKGILTPSEHVNSKSFQTWVWNNESRTYKYMFYGCARCGDIYNCKYSYHPLCDRCYDIRTRNSVNRER